MSMKSKLWFILKLLFSAYLGSAIGYIIMSLGSTKTDYFLKAISPSVLYHQIIIGSPLVILFAVLGIIVFLFFK